KLEGQYGTDRVLDLLTFKNGTATVRVSEGAGGTLECWMEGSRVYLHLPGTPSDQDVQLEFAGDGSLQSPFGRLTRTEN
ncbi:MAG TPA: hypothetical protein VFY29_15265, partial [Terriglobia bacterium]|nr:hypothetical protein [Terriglobia bacterium]